jgi:S-disulfanyl-L-cysteine oxidoreductase SoxD
MRLYKPFIIVVALAACSTGWAQKGKTDDFGRPPTPEEIQALDISISPTGKELPPGKGTAKEGAKIYASKCAVCHGPTGHEGGVLANGIVGPKGTRGGIQTLPFTSTIWDFINRAMPRFNEGTLTHDQVYGLTAFLLFRAGIIKEDDVMDAKSLPAVQMPNRNGFVPSDLAEIGNFDKRQCRLGHCPGPEPASAKVK